MRVLLDGPPGTTKNRDDKTQKRAKKIFNVGLWGMLTRHYVKKHAKRKKYVKKKM